MCYCIYSTQILSLVLKLLFGLYALRVDIEALFCQIWSSQCCLCWLDIIYYVSTLACICVAVISTHTVGQFSYTHTSWWVYLNSLLDFEIQSRCELGQWAWEHSPSLRILLELHWYLRGNFRLVALHCKLNCLHLLQMLVKNGALIVMSNKYGDTPLSKARPRLRKKLEGKLSLHLRN